MRRRAFLAGLGCAVARPLTAGAQQQMPVVGVLSSGVADTSASFLIAFRQGLNDSGYIEGRNVTTEYYWGEDQYHLMPALAEHLNARHVAVIAAFGNVAARAAKSVTTTTPVVFLVGSDPVRIGLVDSLNRPGTNMTGISILNADLETKRLELLTEVVPQATTIAFLVNPDSPTTEIKLREMTRATNALGRQLDVINASAPHDFDEAFAGLAKQSNLALIIASDNMFGNHSKELAGLAGRQAIPVISAYRDFAMAGGLMSYGTNIAEANRQVGNYTGRILGGAKPGELPVVQSTKVEFVVNLKAARALGLTISLPLLGRADEVIE
jgi:putative ABC transport system substrate-binding protein